MLLQHVGCALWLLGAQLMLAATYCCATSRAHVPLCGALQPRSQAIAALSETPEPHTDFIERSTRITVWCLLQWGLWCPQAQHWSTTPRDLQAVAADMRQHRQMGTSALLDQLATSLQCLATPQARVQCTVLPS
ncbi:hypothetical protein B0H14DRAFT_2605619 [Mycena olivaceomarginata]|nr:hypothetical protein B0H14DRAFT_2605619 [Mycena olivaceomarginata]